MRKGSRGQNLVFPREEGFCLCFVLRCQEFWETLLVLYLAQIRAFCEPRLSSTDTESLFFLRPLPVHFAALNLGVLAAQRPQAQAAISLLQLFSRHLANGQ